MLKQKFLNWLDALRVRLILLVVGNRPVIANWDHPDGFALTESHINGIVYRVKTHGVITISPDVRNVWITGVTIDRSN